MIRELPLDMPEIAPVKPAPPSAVLVVEADADVRLLVRLALQFKGLVVLDAPGGHDGVAIYRRDFAAIAVVVMDADMPLMSGPHALQLMREANPGVVCFFMTGSGDEAVWRRLEALSPARIFAKPFRVLDLADAVWDKVHAFRAGDDQAEAPPCCG